MNVPALAKRCSDSQVLSALPGRRSHNLAYATFDWRPPAPITVAPTSFNDRWREGQDFWQIIS